MEHVLGITRAVGMGPPYAWISAGGRTSTKMGWLPFPLDLCLSETISETCSKLTGTTLPDPRGRETIDRRNLGQSKDLANPEIIKMLCWPI